MRICTRILNSSKASSFIVRNCSAAAAKPAPKPEEKPQPVSESKPKKLPVPPLSATLRKFLRTARPFLSAEEFIKSEEVVREFIKPGGLGEKLHCLLEERANEEDNWLEEWWLKTAYLSYRNPVIVFSSPAQVFPWHQFKSEEDFIMAGTKCVLGALDYLQKIRDGKIKQEMMGKDALDMTQYYKVFGTNRSPSLPDDKLKFSPDSCHYVVISNSHFYKLSTTNHGKPLDVSTVFHQLKQIVEETKDVSGPYVGILTTDCRDKWAESYEYILKDANNRNCIKTIEEALFILCLDKNCPDVVLNNQTTTSLQVLHGGGAAQNSGNRWYDKTIQFVVSRDGGMGIAYEHSPSEGGIIASIMDHVNTLMDCKMCYNIPECPPQAPEPFCFTVDDCLNSKIMKTIKTLTILTDNLELCCFSFNDFGKDEIKNFKVSPDSFIQMAIQYAFYKIHKLPGAQYESGSLRRFIRGRTEAIRSCSVESIEFAEAMLDDSLSCKSKARVLREAINYHRQYVVAAMDMRGVDRYLLGLKLIAETNSIAKPVILDDESYKRSSHFRLSTSQVPSKADGFMVYGPLTEDGYGCCYNPRDKNINFGTSSFKSTGTTSAAVFRESLECALREMKEVLSEPVAKL